MLNCPQTETKDVADMLSCKNYIVNDLSEMLNDL